jgi:DNA-binding response OmpR family regulator
MGKSQELPDLRRRALVVDDDPAIRAFLTDFLEQQDFEVYTAQDGRSALAVFHTARFNLLLVDFQMPGITGLEVATEVRKTDLAIPIGLITGTASTLEAEAVVQAGVSRLFPKPFSLAELALWIRSISC